MTHLQGPSNFIPLFFPWQIIKEVRVNFWIYIYITLLSEVTAAIIHNIYFEKSHQISRAELISDQTQAQSGCSALVGFIHIIEKS